MVEVDFRRSVFRMDSSLEVYGVGSIVDINQEALTDKFQVGVTGLSAMEVPVDMGWGRTRQGEWCHLNTNLEVDIGPPLTVHFMGGHEKTGI